MSSIKLKELFASIQGEGPLVGYKQIFMRLCGCNLKCKYCYNYWKKENDNIVDIEKYNPKKTLKQFMKSVKCDEITFSRWRTNNQFSRVIGLYYVC